MFLQTHPPSPARLQVHRTSGITVGLKMYRRSMLNDMERHQIAREIWLHIQLHHPSIIALYAAWKDRDYIYLVLEWAPEVGAGGGSCVRWCAWRSCCLPAAAPACTCLTSRTPTAPPGQTWCRARWVGALQGGGREARV